MFDLMFSGISIFIGIIFIAVFAVIIYRIVIGAKQWNKNNNSPLLTVNASVVAKRSEVSHHVNSADVNHHHYNSVTYYYATFEVESGDRIELQVKSSEYGMLVEGDKGRLSFQGTRYKGFDRII